MSQYDLAFKGETAALRTWLQANKKQVDALSKDRKCTLLYTAVRAGHFECAKMLVDEFGADVNRANGDADVASSPLHAAAFGGFPPCVALLVVRGAKVDAANKLGETPLDNAKSPADGVSAGVKRKCQELLGGDAAAASAAAAMLEVAIKNLAVAVASAGKAAPGAAAAKDFDADAPPAKAKKTTAGATAVTAVAAVPAKPVAPDGVHPLKGKTVVFTGGFVKKKALLEAELVALGGKATGSVSSNTDILVKGKNSGGKELDALYRGVPVWSEAEYAAVVKEGAGAWPPLPPTPECLEPFAKSTHFPPAHRDVILEVLKYTLNNQEETFFFPAIHLPKRPCPTVHEIGVKYLAPLLAATPSTAFILSINTSLDSNDVSIIFDALVKKRASSLPDVTLINLGNQKDVDDEGARVIAEALPKMKLKVLYLYAASLTQIGIKLLLSALERAPSMERLELQDVAGASEAVKQWKPSSGKNVKCVVLTD